MAWNCELYREFKKKLNSTKHPGTGEVYPCLMKHDTDFLHPTLEIQAEDLSDVTYMRFNTYFYYVTNLISHRTGVWEVTGARDPMASFKEDIVETPALVEYSKDGNSGDAGHGCLPDPRIPISREPARDNYAELIAGDFTVDPTGGSYILSAIGEAGGVITYIITQSDMASLITGLDANVMTRMANYFTPGTYPADEIDALNIIKNGLYGVLSKELAYGNYADCIKSCYWIPFSGFSGGGDQYIYLGDFPTGKQGKVYGTKVISQTFNIPMNWPVNGWRRNSVLWNLYLPFCGTIAIPTDKVINANAITVQMSLDIVGATVAYRVAAYGYTLAVTGANVGAPYAIGSSNITLNSFMSGAMAAVGGGISAGVGLAAAAATGGAAGLGSAAGGISSLISGVGQAISPQIQCAGSMGGNAAAGLLPYIRLESLYYEPLGYAAFQSQYGYPCMKVMAPGLIASGFISCRGFSVDCAATPEEKALINQYMNNGAYIE